MAKGKKDTNAVIQLKINQILGCILKGYTTLPDICRYVSIQDENKRKNKDFQWLVIGKNQRTIQRYMKQAKEIIAQEGRRTIDQLKITYRLLLMDLYREAREKGELKTCNFIMRNLIYLDSLGSVNLRETFDILKFDVKLTEKEEKEYYKRLRQYCTPSLLVDNQSN